MITLVSLLFITTIPIDCKITKFPYTCTKLKKQGWLPIPADIQQVNIKVFEISTRISAGIGNHPVYFY